jgi:hypothetical protein
MGGQGPPMGGPPMGGAMQGGPPPQSAPPMGPPKGTGAGPRSMMGGRGGGASAAANTNVNSAEIASSFQNILAQF